LTFEKKKVFLTIGTSGTNVPVDTDEVVVLNLFALLSGHKVDLFALDCVEEAGVIRPAFPGGGLQITLD
jgi:hypothetical protein